MLGVDMHTTIQTLFNKGYSKTKIAEIVGADRKTIAKVLKDLDEKGHVERKKKTSMLDQFEEYLQIQVKKDLSAKRIFQDLQRDFQYEGSYDTVKKYVKKLKISPKKVYMVLNTLAGEEAQVDFGYIGTIKVNNRNKKAWIFVMTLSYSRYMYVQIVFDQKVITFIDCHINAFKYFSGVPQTVKIDNLKAAILKADFYEPEVQKDYAVFATHYGFWAQPCRVYTPTDKGKVESNVNYVKENCFKGRDFKDIHEASEFCKEWLATVANVRIHGTTKKIPKDIFETVEKKTLQPLPVQEFISSKLSKAKVNSNCHISYQNNYYSVPYSYIGETVDVLEINNIIKIVFNDKEIALHSISKNTKGHFNTKIEHYPHNKNITSKEILSRQRETMSTIGAGALEFFDLYINKCSNKYDYKSISGIISLQKKYDNETINNACIRALSYGALTYKVVKKICESNLSNLPIETNETYINTNETHISRNVSDYNNLMDLGEIKNE